LIRYTAKEPTFSRLESDLACLAGPGVVLG